MSSVGFYLRRARRELARHPGVISFLLRMKGRAPRLVLRTACERLPAAARRRILACKRMRSVRGDRE